MIYSIDAYAYGHINPDSPDKYAWFDAYGIWFAGKLRTSIILRHGRKWWPYFDTELKKITEGEHEVDVWGKQATLVFWKAQGYPRGVIVMPDETDILEAARQIARGKPWRFDEVLALKALSQETFPAKKLAVMISAEAEPEPEEMYCQ